jgi:hypothetical protein
MIIFLKICAIFYNSSTVKTLQNRVDALLLIKGFPTIPRIRQEAMWFGRSQHDKQNKQTNNLPS